MGAKASAETQYAYKCLGLEIQFPFEPYGTQKAMMNKITSYLTNKEHSLIESPTGTGKTLVLLCSTLAWMTKSKEIQQPFISTKLRKKNAEERRTKMMKKPCTCGRRGPTEYQELKEAKENVKKGCGQEKWSNKEIDLTHSPLQCVDPDPKRAKIETICLSDSPYFVKSEKTTESPHRDYINIDDAEDWDDSDSDCKIVIFEDEQKKQPQKTEKQEEEIQVIHPPKQEAVCQTSKPIDIDDDRPMCQSCMALDAEKVLAEVLGEDSMDSSDMLVGKHKSTIPRIYYGTRTHKQISQVVRELNKTYYKTNLRMCILSSRERTCVNEEVRYESDRNDKCINLIKNRQSNGGSKKKSDSETCNYYHDTNQTAANFDMINDDFKLKAWDIEEAADWGRRTGTCPYYGTRSLQENADITLCPYNYLLDPTIRSNMNINLKNAIVIFDEAHNIEDICRDSASFLIDTKQLEDIVNTINIASSHYVQGSNISNAYMFFKTKLQNLGLYLRNFQFKPSDKDNFDQSERSVIPPSGMLQQLNKFELGPNCLAQYKENLKALKGDDDDSEGSKKSQDADDPALSFAQMQHIKQLHLALDFMYIQDCKHLNDYRMVVAKTLDRESGGGGRFGGNRGGYRGKNQPASNQQSDVYTYHLSLLCMNPAVSFNKIHSLAWSVIVASGTLSPIESLKSELGCTFAQPFEGRHVIDGDRIFASIVSQGPSQVDLNCAYTNSLRLDFQDEVGQVIKDVCLSVPYGVLCFFPSYDRMECFYQRWFTKGILIDIEKAGKKLFRERKNLSAADFEKDLAKYNRLAKNKGALLFAVFRGKVSEGIDFADNAARAVITIGIPYPNVKEVTVGLKREYNDNIRSKRPELMTGSDWYATQAFRALNQALGRCIRHKNDWGAIIMIDSRLNWASSNKNISKWLLREMIDGRDYSIFRDRLRDFVRKRKLEMESSVTGDQVELVETDTIQLIDEDSLQ